MTTAMRLRVLSVVACALCAAAPILAQPTPSTAGICPYKVPVFSETPITGVSETVPVISATRWDALAESVARMCAGTLDVPPLSGTTAPASCEPPSLFFDTDETPGENLYCCTSTDTWTKCSGSGGGGVADLLYLRDEKTSGTAAGGSSAATWNVRTLNTEVVDQIGSTLSANQFDLPAGTYRIHARAPAWQVNRHKVRLRNITDTATACVGMSAYAGATFGVITPATLSCRLTIAGTKTFELQHYTQTTMATSGLGLETSSGEIEIYAELWIEQEP